MAPAELVCSATNLLDAYPAGVIADLLDAYPAGVIADLLDAYPAGVIADLLDPAGVMADLLDAYWGVTELASVLACHNSTANVLAGRLLT